MLLFQGVSDSIVTFITTRGPKFKRSSPKAHIHLYEATVFKPKLSTLGDTKKYNFFGYFDTKIF